MGILRGHFAMTLVVTAPDERGRRVALRADLDQRRRRACELEALTLRARRRRRRLLARRAGLASCRVYGADHPGILAAVTARLAAIGANVCDLRTRLVGEQAGAPVYVHDHRDRRAGDETALRAALDAVAAEQGVEVSLNALETDVL